MTSKSPIKQKPLKFTQTIQDRNKSKLRKNPQSFNYYFCHYNNAVYMGETKSFKKNGRGILFLDNGGCILTEYSHDIPNGHHIAFYNGCIISKVHNSNRTYSVAFRCNKYLLYLNFTALNKIDGPGSLIDFSKGQVTNLIYKKNTLMSFQAYNVKGNHNNIFQHRTYKSIIGQTHSNGLLLKMPLPKGVQLRREGNKITIGFLNNRKLQGLAFFINFHKNNSSNCEFSSHISERGYYVDNLMHGFGQKSYSNGNIYVGYFSKGQFEGTGFMIYYVNKKWIKGKFSKGQLSDINYIVEDYNENILNEAIETVHRNDSCWIGSTIQSTSENFYYNCLDELLNAIACKNEQKEQKNDNEILLRKIQNNFFSSRHHTDTILQVARKSIQKKMSKQKAQTPYKQIQAPTKIQMFEQRGQSLSSENSNSKQSFIKIREEDNLQNAMSQHVDKEDSLLSVILQKNDKKQYTKPQKYDEKRNIIEEINIFTSTSRPYTTVHDYRSNFDDDKVNDQQYPMRTVNDIFQQRRRKSPSFYRKAKQIMDSQATHQPSQNLSKILLHKNKNSIGRPNKYQYFFQLDQLES